MHALYLRKTAKKSAAMIAQTSNAIAEGPHVHEKWAGRAIFGGDSSYVADLYEQLTSYAKTPPLLCNERNGGVSYVQAF